MENKTEKLKGKNIILGITGGIAAYKIPLLIRMLKKAGAEVQVVVTEGAKHFVTPLTLAALSGRPVISKGFDTETGEWESHIKLGLWADAILIAPLTANTMGKMAAGIADNILLTTVLSARCPVLFSPSMDVDMFHHDSTGSNIKTLQSFGYHYIPPASGWLASGMSGDGRMPEPEELFRALTRILNPRKRLAGKKVLVSAGPTYENIDPVRFIGNRSSGKMGYALAEAFAGEGAEVFLVSGPVHISTAHPDIHVVPVTTAEEMYREIHRLFPQSDICVMAAAVADYTPEKVSDNKIKKKGKGLILKLKPTKDILASLGKIKKKNQILIGFALETNDEKNNALKKLKNKNLDFIVLNSLNDKGAGFAVSTNKITILDRNGESVEYELKSKKEVAKDIVEYLMQGWDNENQK